MPLNATEIEGLTEFVQTTINADESLARQGETSNVNFQRVNADFFSIQDDGFAGLTINHIETLGSNDPDDLLIKVNEIIDAINQQRRQ